MYRNRLYRVKTALTILIATIVLSETAKAQGGHEGEFPFFRSFLDNKHEGISIPDADGNQARLIAEKGMRLTNSTNQLGYFYLDNHLFSSQYGVVIEFEFIMNSTSGGLEPLDGICMVLFDATSVPMQAGAKGAGLGYTYNRSINRYSEHRKQGIAGAYLGVGLDNGMFKNRRLQGEELRAGIAYDGQGSSIEPTENNVSSSVTIRGAVGNATRKIGPGNVTARNWGYPVLVTRSTKDNRIGYKLDTDEGLFILDANPPITTPFFELKGGGEFTTPNDPEYRKAIIKLEPNPDTNVGGFMISVTIKHGRHESLIIDKYPYPAQVTFVDNGTPDSYSTSGFPNIVWPQPVIRYNTPAPEKFRIGFTASTGKHGYMNMIKNLRITVADAADAQDDYYYFHRRGPATTRPLENDKAYKKENTPIGRSQDKEHVDPTSFRFWQDENNLSSNLYECEITNQGKWKYDPRTLEAIFFPKQGFKGVASIRYDIKGQFSPYDENLYRSSQATIYIEIDDNQPN